MNTGNPRGRPATDIDLMIGRLDRLLSEFLLAAEDPNLDEADRQTIKHHADDLIGVGGAALKKLERPVPLAERCLLDRKILEYLDDGSLNAQASGATLDMIRAAVKAKRETVRLRVRALCHEGVIDRIEARGTMPTYRKVQP